MPSNVTPGNVISNNAFVDEGPLSVVKQDPTSALKVFQRQNGGPTKGGKVAKYRESMMAQAYQAYLTLLDLGGNAAGVPLDLANQGSKMFMERLASGQGVGGFLRENADRALNGYGGTKGIEFSTMESPQIMNLMKLLSGASNFGVGTMGNYGNENMLDDLQYQADIQDLYEPQGSNQKKNASVLNAPGGGREQFQKIIQRYLAMK